MPCVVDEEGNWARVAVDWSNPDHLMRYVASYAGPEFFPWMPSVSISEKDRAAFTGGSPSKDLPVAGPTRTPLTRV